MQPAFCIFSSYLPIHQNILKLFPIHPHVHTPCQGWPRLWQSSKPSFRIATDSRSWYQLNQNVTKEMASTYLHFASILSSAWLYISITVTLSVCAARASLCRRLLLWRHSSRSHSQQQQLRPAAGLLQKAEPAFPSSAAASSSDAMQQHRQPTAHLPGNRAIPHHITSMPAGVRIFWKPLCSSSSSSSSRGWRDAYFLLSRWDRDFVSFSLVAMLSSLHCLL